MLKKAAICCVSLSLLMSSLARAELNVMAINTEWLWSPHDGRVDGSMFNKGDMSPDAYRKELAFYAGLVEKNELHIVALSEIENESVVNDLAKALGSSWRGYFVQGRDTATGQDVALLSRLDYVPGSLTAFGFPSGRIPGESKKKSLTKLVGAQFKHPQSGKIIAVITAHFLSKRNDSIQKAKKRLRQSYALRKVIRKMTLESDSVLVLGDLNDLRGSPVIEVLEQDLSNAEAHCFNTQQSKQSRIVDHILYTDLVCTNYQRVNLKSFSDHYGVFARFQ